MIDVDNLIATAQALLCLAEKLNAEGRASEACELYRRAFQQGIMIQQLKQLAEAGSQASFGSSIEFGKPILSA
ncbi:MAG: hypothetical protein C0464_01055 [Cyanobacteria bacterium DS2.008]|nr:hypothetical protein [Cyanobacteria bacterium DS2.008]